jgi:hypothetical protein
MITQLKSNQVFVFGANAGYWHGMGAAGFAFRFNPEGNWRNDNFFLLAAEELKNKNYGLPHNQQNLIGKWAVLGEGPFTIGKEGKSYGVITTERPGFRGYVNSDFLIKEIKNFLKFAKLHPEWEFLCANFGLNRQNGGFSWWTPEELREIWFGASDGKAIPTNIRPPTYLK